MSDASIEPLNRELSRNELRLLNCIYLLKQGAPAPFIPMPPHRVADLPRENTAKDIRIQVLEEIEKGLHPNSKTRGQIIVGDLQTSTKDFYETVMGHMEHGGFTARSHQPAGGKSLDTDYTLYASQALPDRNKKQLEHAIALSLGAQTFEQLGEALTSQRQIAHREKLVENLAPVFTHIYQWLADHLTPVRKEEALFVGDELKPLAARRDIMVWERMIGVMSSVEDAFNRAIRKGALDQKAIFYLGKNAHHLEEAMPGITVWSAPAQALLDAGLEVVRDNLEKKPGNAELKKLERILETAQADRREAETLKPPGYDRQVPPKGDVIPPHWAGARLPERQTPQIGRPS
jgi:hypothetical protein